MNRESFVSLQYELMNRAACTNYGSGQLTCHVVMQLVEQDGTRAAKEACAHRKGAAAVTKQVSGIPKRGQQDSPVARFYGKTCQGHLDDGASLLSQSLKHSHALVVSPRILPQYRK